MTPIKAIRLLTALQNGLLSGAVMQTLLGDSGRLADFNLLLSVPGQAKALADSATAMTALIDSAIALAAVIASPTALAEMVASSTAMNAIWASNTATDAFLASSAARLAVYNSAVALTALQANPTQVQRKVTSGATLITNAWLTNQVIVAYGTIMIILRRYYSGVEWDYLNWGRTDYPVAALQGALSGPVAGSGGRTLSSGSAARGCISGTYTDNGLSPANDATGNFVCAANGLRRWNTYNLATLYLYYIPV